MTNEKTGWQLSPEIKNELAEYLAECRILAIPYADSAFLQGVMEYVFYFENRAAAFNFQELLSQTEYNKFQSRPATNGGVRVTFTGYENIRFNEQITSILESHPEIKVFSAYTDLVGSIDKKTMFSSELESSYALGEALKAAVLFEQVPSEPGKTDPKDVQGFLYFRNSKQRNNAFKELKDAFPNLPEEALEKRTDSERGDHTYYDIYVRDKDLLHALEKSVEKQVSPVTEAGTARTSRTPLGENGRRILREGTGRAARREPALV